MDFLQSWKDKILKDDITTLAAALAFYTTFSLAPLLLLVLGLLASTGLGMQEQLVSQTQALLGPSVAESVRAIVSHAGQQRGLITIANWSGVITLLLSASFVFAQLQASLNVIFEASPDTLDVSGWGGWVKNYIAKRLLCMGIVLTFVFLLIVSLLASAAIAMLLKPSGGLLVRGLQAGGSFVAFALLFAAIFRWMPDRRVSGRAALKGGAITAVFFEVGKQLIGLYLGRAGVGSAYGAAGSLIVLLVWVYYTSVIIFAGAEVSFLLDRGRKKEKPAEAAEKLSA